MATSSEVKSGLDAIAKAIAGHRSTMKSYKGGAGTVVTSLNAIATDYADLIATINAYGTSDAFEALSKAELAKLTTEFSALKTQAQTVAGISV